MKEKTKGRIWFYIVFGIILLFVFAWAFTMYKFSEEREKCAKEYGGRVIQGHCTYVENGSSKSFDIWEEELSK